MIRQSGGAANRVMSLTRRHHWRSIYQAEASAKTQTLRGSKFPSARDSLTHYLSSINVFNKLYSFLRHDSSATVAKMILSWSVPRPNTVKRMLKPCCPRKIPLPTPALVCLRLQAHCDICMAGSRYTALWYVQAVWRMLFLEETAAGVPYVRLESHLLMVHSSMRTSHAKSQIKSWPTSPLPWSFDTRKEVRFPASPSSNFSQKAALDTDLVMLFSTMTRGYPRLAPGETRIRDDGKNTVLAQQKPWLFHVTSTGWTE